jgi:hypothetical protein
LWENKARGRVKGENLREDGKKGKDKGRKGERKR